MSEEEQEEGEESQYFALNLRSELPSHEELNFRYNDSSVSPSKERSSSSGPRSSSSGTRSSSSGSRGGKRGACDILLEAAILSPFFVLLCGVVLLPSAVYFIPTEFFNIAEPNVTAETSNTSMDVEDDECSQGFFHDLNDNNTCRPSCAAFMLDSGMGEVSVYRIAVMVAAALSCASAIGFLSVALTLKRKTL